MEDPWEEEDHLWIEILAQCEETTDPDYSVTDQVDHQICTDPWTEWKKSQWIFHHQEEEASDDKITTFILVLD